MKKRLKRVVTVILTVLLVLAQIFPAFGGGMTPTESKELISVQEPLVEDWLGHGKNMVNDSENKASLQPLQISSTKNISAVSSKEEKKLEGIIPGKLLVKYRSNISYTAKSSLNSSVSAISERTDKKLGITELELPEDTDVIAAADKLNEDSNVVFAEPIYERKAYSLIVEDSVVESVYCMEEFYQKGWQWGLQAVNMEELWGEANEEAQADIVIAVIDTGVDMEHPEFNERLVDGYDFINDDDNPDDDYGHGTHVAGIAAAGSNSSGMGGVAPGVKIMPIKILDENGFGDTSTEINGIIYAVNNGADVINLSIGGASRSYGEQLAIEYALEHGVVVVAAAGNDGYSNVDYPARYEGVISVGAADWNGTEFEMAGFSNYGSGVDIVAPGADILSAIPEELDTIYSGVGDAKEDGYALMSGTSMATPFAAGMAAMMLAKGEGLDEDSELSISNQILLIMRADAVQFVHNAIEYKLLNGSSADTDNPPVFKQMILMASKGLEMDTVDLYLLGSNYRNHDSATLEGTFAISKVPYTMDEFGNLSLGDIDEAGTIDVSDGEGRATVDIDGACEYLFFAEGNEEYLDSAAVHCKEDNDSFEDAFILELGETEYDSIDESGEEDYYKFTTPAGSEAMEYIIEAVGNMDNYGSLYNSDQSLIAENDDGGWGVNFQIIQTLQPATTYYVKVRGFSSSSTGYYGLLVEEKSEAADIEITGRISLPGSNIAEGDIKGKISLIARYLDYEYQEYYYNTISTQEFTISSGASQVAYTLGAMVSEDYIIAYRLETVDSSLSYIPVAFYNPGETVLGIDSARVITETQSADIELIEKTSAEASGSEYNTKDDAEELELAVDTNAKTDYLGDTDYYHISLTEPGNYMIRTIVDLNDVDELSLFVYDDEGNTIIPELVQYIYQGYEIIGTSGICGFEAGDYYLKINSDGTDIYSRSYIDFNPLELQMQVCKASEVSCDLTLPEGMSGYEGSFYLWDDEGISYSIWERIGETDKIGPLLLPYIPEDAATSIFVPYSNEASYVLGYASEGYNYFIKRAYALEEEEYAYDEMGYYSYNEENETSATVPEMAAATPIYADKDTDVAFEIVRILDTGNDSMDTAFVPALDTYTKGTINNITDADYFKLSVAAAGTYTLSFESKNSYIRRISKVRYDNSMSMLLYEKGKWVEYAQGAKGSMTKQLQAGDYYIKIIGSGYFIGRYELAIESSPIASNISISGTRRVEKTLTGNYIYTDGQNDPETGSTYRWLRADIVDGGFTAIAGATDKYYRLTSSDLNKYIKFEVTPASGIEPKSGVPVVSSVVGPVLPKREEDNNSKQNGGNTTGNSGSSPGAGSTIGSESTASGIAEIIKRADGSTVSVVQVDESKLAGALNLPGTAPVTVDVRTSTNADNVDVSMPSGILAEATRLNKPVVIESNNVSFEIQPGTIATGNSNETFRLQVNQLTLDAVPEAARNKEASADEVSMVFDFSMYLGNTKIIDFNKPITITVKFDPSKVIDSNKLGVYYYNEKDNKWEYVGGKVNADGTITFTVEHFSKYAVMEYKKSFEDIKTHWAKYDIELMLFRQITKGVDQNNFAPDRKLSRAEFVVMLARALKLDEASDKSFEDVADKAWYKEYLQKADAAGIIGGSSRFSPEELITREQMAEMLVKAYFHSSGKKLEDIRTTQQIRFKDEGMAEGTTRESIILADALELMGGNPDGTFVPKGKATRAEAAVTIKRLLQKLNKL